MTASGHLPPKLNRLPSMFLETFTTNVNLFVPQRHSQLVVFVGIPLTSDA